MKLDHKSVTVMANPDAGERCIVFLLDKYLRKLPVDVADKNFFYC